VVTARKFPLFGQKVLEITPPRCGIFTLAKALGFGGIKHSLYAAAQSGRSLRSLGPNRLENVQNVGHGYLVHALAP
jgi:hypothetical protein